MTERRIEDIAGMAYGYYVDHLSPEDRDQLERDKEKCVELAEGGNPWDLPIDSFPKSLWCQFLFVSNVLRFLSAQNCPGTEEIPSFDLPEDDPAWQWIAELSIRDILEICWRETRLHSGPVQ